MEKRRESIAGVVLRRVLAFSCGAYDRQALRGPRERYVESVYDIYEKVPALLRICPGERRKRSLVLRQTYPEQAFRQSGHMLCAASGTCPERRFAADGQFRLVRLVEIYHIREFKPLGLVHCHYPDRIASQGRRNRVLVVLPLIQEASQVIPVARHIVGDQVQERMDVKGFILQHAGIVRFGLPQEFLALLDHRAGILRSREFPVPDHVPADLVIPVAQA